MPNFKYAALLEEVNNMGCDCQPHTYDRPNMIAYRFIFENDVDNKNHLPNRKISPKRKLSALEEYCSACGLSTYNTEDNAKLFYSNLIDTHPNIYKNIGDSLCVGKLSPEDGTMSMVDEFGHFDFYEFLDCDPHKIFSFASKLI